MADDRRQIAEDVTRALSGDDHLRVHTDLDAWDCAYIADLLLPLIDRVKAEAAADALSDAADYVNDWGANAARYKATVGMDTVENATATARELAYGRAARNLQARAAELRPAHTSTDAQEAK